MASETRSALREFAADLAWQAGKLTMRYFQTGITPDLKADESPVTVADRESERLMRELIEARYPTHSILGEEEGETRPGAAFKWILDPIDGTKTFVRGVPLYAVLVGVEHEGEMIVGAVNIPAMGDFLHAATGQGCLWNGRPARVSPVNTLDAALLLSTDSEAMEQHGHGAAYRRLVAATKMQRTWGDAYGYVLLATGRAEIMADAAISPWDCAAIVPVLQEAGGTFTDWSGEPTIYGPDGLGTNGYLLPAVLAMVNQ